MAILKAWQKRIGPWPELIKKPAVESVDITRRENVTQRQIRVGIGLNGEMVEACLLVPDGDGPFPAVLVVSDGIAADDLSWQLALHDFVTLLIEKSNGASTLSEQVYMATNAHTVLAQRPEVYPDRIGIVGQAGAGTWAMLACCLYDSFDCGVWSAPEVSFAQYGSNDLHDLYTLMAPRPFMLVRGAVDRSKDGSILNPAIAVNRLLDFKHRVAMTSSNWRFLTNKEPIYRFFQWWLQEKVHAGS
jgi:hypothetical protein